MDRKPRKVEIQAREEAMISADRPTTLEPIEITPEMIDAGEDVLLCTIGGPEDLIWHPRDLAEKVFLAMKCLETSSK